TRPVVRLGHRDLVATGRCLRGVHRGQPDPPCRVAPPLVPKNVPRVPVASKGRDPLPALNAGFRRRAPRGDDLATPLRCVPLPDAAIDRTRRDRAARRRPRTRWPVASATTADPPKR